MLRSLSQCSEPASGSSPIETEAPGTSPVQAPRRSIVVEDELRDALGRMTRIATSLFDVDVAFVSLLSSDRQWVREGVGLDRADSCLATSLCTLTVEKEALVVLENAGMIDRVRAGSLSQKAHPCFYAGVPVYTPAGEPIGTFSIMNDDPRSFSGAQRDRLRDLGQMVTEELGHRRERKRKERSRQFDAVFEDPDMLAGVLSPDGTLLEANRTALQRIEACRDDVVGQPFWETPWWPDRIRAKIRACVKRAATGEYVRYDAELVDRRNRTYNIEGTVRPVRGPTGAVTSLIVSARDTTKRKRREEQLRKASAQLEALFEHSPDMINVHNVEGTLLRANLRFFHRTGYRRSDLRDLKIWDLLASTGPQKAAELWMNMEVGGQRRFEGMYRCKEGSTFPVEIHVRRLRLEGKDRFAIISREVTDQKRQEQRLQQADTLFRNAQDALFLLDVDDAEKQKPLTYRRINPVYEEKFGCSEDEIRGHSPKSVYGEDHGQDMEEKCWECIRRQEPTEYEETIPLDGEQTYWRTCLAPVIMDGEVRQIVGTTRDITEQRRRKEQLERQNDLFDRAQEIASVGAWEYDVGTDTTCWTPMVYRIHDYPTEKNPDDDDVTSCYHPEDRSKLEEAFATAVEEGVPYDLELRLRTKSGEERWVRTHGEPQREDGEVVQLRGTIQDITERKERERSLRNRQEKLEGLYEATDHLLQAKNEEDLSARLASLVGKTLGYPATTVRLARGDELVPTHVPSMVKDHMPERPSYDINGNTPAAEAHRSGETRVLDDPSVETEGRDRGDMRAIAYVPMGAHGLISVGSFEAGGIGPFNLRLLEVLGGYAALVLDRLEREGSLREAKAKAEEANRMKSSFLANMSHEIRTPLTSVIGFAEAAGTAADELDLPEGSPLPRYTDLIEQGGRRLLETLEGVLNLSKLEAGKMELSAEPVDLAAEAQQAAEEFCPEAREEGIDLRLEIDPAQARADAGGVQIVVRNLVTNAIKYTEEGGTVWVRTRREEGEAVLGVEDTGIGMEPEVAEDLFEPFRQASEGLSRQYEGTGVGLAVTKTATQRMNGTLEVETEKAKGSQFTVRLPAAGGGEATN